MVNFTENIVLCAIFCNCISHLHSSPFFILLSPVPTSVIMERQDCPNNGTGIGIKLNANEHISESLICPCRQLDSSTTLNGNPWSHDPED